MVETPAIQGLFRGTVTNNIDYKVRRKIVSVCTPKSCSLLPRSMIWSCLVVFHGLGRGRRPRRQMVEQRAPESVKPLQRMNNLPSASLTPTAGVWSGGRKDCVYTLEQQDKRPR